MSGDAWRHLLLWLAALGFALLVGWLLAKYTDATMPYYDPVKVGAR